VNVPDTQTLVLGGGIAGCVTACLLADAGVPVTIVERRDRLMDGASRWNEGKIHLGYIYIGTESMATSRLMQQGAAVFEGLLERVLGRPLDDQWFSDPVTYLVEPDSMVDAETLWSRTLAVASALREEGRDTTGLRAGLRRYVPDGPLVERLLPEDAAERTGQSRIAAAWRTTERAISPRPMAEGLRAAVAERAIPVVQARVVCAEATPSGWRIELENGGSLSARVLVNSLWEERALIDRQVHTADDPVSIRYRYALFGRRLSSRERLPPVSRILGRHGDVTSYGDGDACLTWYPAGLVARSDLGIPPVVPAVEREAFIHETLRGLGLEASVLGARERWEIGGGFVVAHGYGDIDRLDSPLHRRDRAGVRELRPGYISIDTGKLTLGPLLAMRAADLVRRRLETGADA
jgi:hypothetical protein